MADGVDTIFIYIRTDKSAASSAQETNITRQVDICSGVLQVMRTTKVTVLI